MLVASLGHAHPGYEKAYNEYCRGLPRTSYNFVTSLEVNAARRILQSMRDNPNAQKVLWAATGSEGIQKAMWAALAYRPKRKIIVATRGGFHGKKGLAGDVSGDESQNPNVRWLSFPMDDVAKPEDYRKELDDLWRANRNRIALLITEPYLGAKGSYHPPKWYHPLLAKWCKDHGIAYILDEVQSCHGRTGNLYAYQTYGVEPDLVVLGKGMGNGEPVSAVVGRGDILDALDFGEASDTYSGNPRACAAVCATLDIFKRERIIQNCRSRSAELEAHLRSLMQDFGFIRQLRGEGLVWGVEMKTAKLAERAILEAYRGTGKEGVHFLGPLEHNVLRVSPPLTVSSRELRFGYETLKSAWTRI